MSDSAKLKKLSLNLHKAFLETGLTLATAESCTGGWIGKLITDHPNSSQYYRGGIVAYCNKAKRKLLNVKIGDCDEAVTSPVAKAMALGALKEFGADLSVSTTGYMTKRAGEDLKLQAYVAVAWRKKNKKVSVKIRRIALSNQEKSMRNQNRVSTSLIGLHMILDILRTQNHRRRLT